MFFWGHKSNSNEVGKECLSQWISSPFIVNDMSFPTAEHYMMYSKAIVFGDVQSQLNIMKTSDPREAKKLGRGVVNFNPKEWDNVKYSIVVGGNYHKFTQNKHMGEFLLSTGNSVLAEASPYDKVWGIGMREDDDDAYNPIKWRGQNLLGYALMEVRHQLRHTISGDA